MNNKHDFTQGSIFRGLGDSKLPLIFVAIACVVSIVGNLLFVAVLNMNVVGAALATILAQAVSVILLIVIIRKQEFSFEFSWKDIRFGREINVRYAAGTGTIIPSKTAGILSNEYSSECILDRDRICGTGGNNIWNYSVFDLLFENAERDERRAIRL